MKLDRVGRWVTAAAAGAVIAGALNATDPQPQEQTDQPATEEAAVTLTGPRPEPQKPKTLELATLTAPPTGGITAAACETLDWDETRLGDLAYVANWNALMADGWYGDSSDHAERLYSPGCRE